MISIKELNKDRLDDFFQYLNIHLSENGQKGTALFQPLSKHQSTLSDEWKAKFEDGMNEKAGWRKVWIAINEEEKIAGHIDIRSQNQPNAEHRVLLGMGVDSNFRNLKIGQNFHRSNYISDYCFRNFRNGRFEKSRKNRHQIIIIF